MSKLKCGAYDSLINGQLKQDIKDSRQQGLVCKTDELDGAEVPAALARYLSQVVEQQLNNEKATNEEKAELVNSLINCLHLDDPQLSTIDNAQEKLTAVITQQHEQQLKQTETKLERPLTGFAVSNLFVGGERNAVSVNLDDEIRRDIASSDEICMIVSFIRMSGVRLILDELRKFCEQDGHRLRIITTTYCGITELKAVEQLSKLPNTEIRTSYDGSIERLHAKSYIFVRNSGYDTAYIGSSNLSKSAHTVGLEWNIRVTSVENPHIIKTARATFDRYWNSDNFEKFDKEKFADAIQQTLQPTLSLGHLSRYHLLAHQKAILEQVATVRQVYNNNRNLIVAATGTGKTVVAAFDYRDYANNDGNPGHLLFIAHRKEILLQALHTFRSVMQNPNFGDWMADGHTPISMEHLFVSIQTLNARFNDFSQLAEYYDYVVFDECHHIAADSYQRMVNFFKPKILLGLTATPERMDGCDLLKDFGGRISAEVRLPQALESRLLTPFSYLCISDDVDLSDNWLWGNGRYVPNRLTERLNTSDRTQLIINTLQRYLPDEHKCRALCFCCTQEHARYTAEQFNKVGLKADYLTANSNSNHRDNVIRQLAKGEINYLCIVDLFNEGVDIPEVDTVLFLRPTESLTIFLQQLGRGLRLSPGKDLLTVFDFVGQMHRDYDFASRLRALVGNPTVNIKDAVKNGLSRYLPYGCSFYMEPQAQQNILNNISAAVYNVDRLTKELRRFDNSITLTQFVEALGIDIRLIYRNNHCWTDLLRRAGKLTYTDDDMSQRLTRNLANLLHINSSRYLGFIQRYLDAGCHVPNEQASDDTFATMLYYALIGERIKKANFSSRDEALQKVASYPLFVNEITQIVSYLTDHITHQTVQLDEPGMPEMLEVYGCYTRGEVFTIFGKQTAEKTMQGSASGVFKIEPCNAELLFVTLNKSDRDFSPTTQYDDYVISADRFHWQSQNTDGHNHNGDRFVNQATTGRRFLLFVRTNKQDAFGTCPFYCFGLVDYVSSHGDFPMSIEWKLRNPVLPTFLPAV